MKKPQLALMMVFLILGCAKISEETVREISIDFVEKNVRFFSRNESMPVGVSEFSIESISSYKQGKNWIVAMHVTAPSPNGNETKKADITLKLDSAGKVLELNGRSVEK